MRITYTRTGIQHWLVRADQRPIGNIKLVEILGEQFWELNLYNGRRTRWMELEHTFVNVKRHARRVIVDWHKRGLWSFDDETDKTALFDPQEPLNVGDVIEFIAATGEKQRAEITREIKL